MGKLGPVRVKRTALRKAQYFARLGAHQVGQLFEYATSSDDLLTTNIEMRDKSQVIRPEWQCPDALIAEFFAKTCRAAECRIDSDDNYVRLWHRIEAQAR